jgi:EAL domain-containing protein (putative c-di-GMP-specific phosphodiesterase class I)/GGDEF domain-containing protein
MMTLGAIFLFSLFLFNRDQFDVNLISKNNLDNKLKERVLFQRSYFDEYKSYTNALQYLIEEFLKNNISEETTEQSLKRAILGLNNLDQIRIMDTDFNELVKISKNSKSKVDVSIWQDSQKINKKHRDYYKYFKDLKENELGISFVDNNIEFGKVEEKPTIRFAYKLFHENKSLGFIIVNINLGAFIENLIKTTLYDVWIIDKHGNFIVNGNNTDEQTLGQTDSSKYKNIKDIFPHHFTNNLDKDKVFLDNHTIMQKIDFLNNEQGLRIILHAKYGHHFLNDWEKVVIFMIIIMFLISLIIGYIYGSRMNKINEKYMRSLFFDKKTDLPNRTKLFNDYYDKMQQVLILIRINNMRQLISVFGLDATDNLIKEFSKKLVEFTNFSEIKSVYQVDQKTFAITYIPDKEQIKSITETLNELFEEEEFFCGKDCSAFFSLSIGVSNPDEIKNIKTSWVEANLALEQAREHNSNCIIFSNNNSIQEGNSQSIFWIKVIKQSLKDNYVVPFAQPIVDKNENIIKYETLIRINYANKIYAPFFFLDIAKESKHYLALSQLMIKNVFEAMSKNSHEFTINLSTYDVLDTDFPNFIFRLLNKYQVGNRLTVEILESEYTIKIDELIQFLSKIRSYGVKVAIDDFGAGHSNFERLLTLSKHLDYLKIDGSLIKNILEDKNSQILINHIHSFSKELGLKTVAEFVENREIFDYLKEVGIDYFQGYYFSKPIPTYEINSN